MKALKFFEISCAIIIGLIMICYIWVDGFSIFNNVDTPEELPESTRECEITILPTEKIYMHRYGTIEDPYREDLHGEIRCSCIRAVRSWGVELPYGISVEDMEPNTGIEIGAVAIFNEKDGGHIGIVTKIGKKGFYIKESNYVECEITERWISFEDNRLIGYYK